MIQLELTYKHNKIWTVTGVAWSFIAVTNLGLILVLFNDLTGAFGLIMSPILILNILLSTILAAYYFKLHTIDYLRLKGTSLSIHKGPMPLRKTLDLSEIEQGRILCNKLVLILKNEKEVEINLSLLTIKDNEKLHAELLRSFQSTSSMEITKKKLPPTPSSLM